jgi:hypothetical protein
MAARHAGREKINKHELMARQNGRCAMCDLSVAFNGNYGGAHIDHNHETRKVRGILCHRCNKGLSFVEDEVFLTQALAYLKKTTKKED